MKEELRREVEFPEKVDVQLDNSSLIFRGPKGRVQRSFNHPHITLAVENRKILLSAPKATKREKMIISSMEAHIRNLVQGVQEPHIYKLKICSGHFPMNVSVSGQELIIKNFLGENVPRRISFRLGVDVKIEGAEIVVTSPDKELAGQTAARIEGLCRITNRDRRIFQDGCYITHKGGEAV